MEHYRMVPEKDVERLRELLAQLADVVPKILDGAGTVSLSTLAAPRPRSKPQNGQGAAVTAAARPASKEHQAKYVMGKSGDVSYADIVVEEMNKPEFTLDEAFRRVMPLVYTDAKRPRDSFRHSLNHDKRLGRVERNGTIWYQRHDLNQLKLNGGAPEGSAPDMQRPSEAG